MSDYIDLSKIAPRDWCEAVEYTERQRWSAHGPVRIEPGFYAKRAQAEAERIAAFWQAVEGQESNKGRVVALDYHPRGRVMPLRRAK